MPLTVLALTATYYTEVSYQRDVTRTVNTSLDNLATEIQRHLENNANLALGMSRAPAVNSFLPVLDALTKNETLPDINFRRARMYHVFEGFQTIIPDTFFLRILDVNGNTLIKVGKRQRSPAIYESLSGINYVEQEIDHPEFVKQLRQLPRDEAYILRLPQHKLRSGSIFNFSLLDYAVPR
mgnify:CR=1 FL=1